MQVVGLIIAVPLFFAAFLGVLGGKMLRWLVDALSIGVAIFNTIACSKLAIAALDQPLVYWFGGWKPISGLAPGVSFFIDPVGAGLAAFTSFLMVMSFVFATEYFKEVKGIFHALMLVFLTGMCGVCLAGDVFNLFVWFELMSATGIALCGYKVEEAGPIQGAINFAITNTIGAFLSLTGIVILYGHVGALNLAQAGHMLANAPADATVIVSFAFIACGFFVKAAMVPFHFWLADAHAVAPTPVCILFSGIMVELGLYMAARVYWAVFASSMSGHQSEVHIVLLTMGVLSAIVGGTLCFLQSHFKRLLAFSTISHTGIMMIGVALLSKKALAGTGLYLLGHGMIKAALFICAGILLNQFGSVDEHELRGKGRPYAGLILLFAGLALSGLPGFIHFKGSALIEEAAKSAGEEWISWIIVASSALTAGAVIRVWVRVFLGLGYVKEMPKNQGTQKHEESETKGSVSLTLMYCPALILLVLAFVLGWMSPFINSVMNHVPWIMDQNAYQANVLSDGHSFRVEHLALPDLNAATEHSLISFGLACVLAWVGLSAWLQERSLLKKPFEKAAGVLHALHSGVAGDYVAWFTAGVAIYTSYLVWG